MSDNQIIALLRLQKINGLGPIKTRKLIGFAGGITAVFENPDLPKIIKMKPKLRAELFNEEYLRAAEAEYAYAQREGIRCLSFQDKDYPKNLSNCEDAPLLMFTKGNINWQAPRVLAVVGTREMTGYGKRFCEAFIEGVAKADPTVVSGLAYGVDICAQTAAMRHGLQTVGCLAHGLDRIYPEAHRRWAQEMNEKGGLVTEFWSKTVPEAHNFIRRNRIIAGLAQATVVIESASKGGSLVTANFSFGYNREVFALPGRSEDPLSEGCNELIRSQKAQLLSSPEQFLEAMGWDSSPVARSYEPFVAPSHWSDLEKRLVELLRKSDRLNLDELVRSINAPVSQVSAALFNLELQGFVLPLPGKYFSCRCK